VVLIHRAEHGDQLAPALSGDGSVASGQMGGRKPKAIAGEHAIFLDRVQFRRAGGQEDRGDVFRQIELARDARPGPVEKQRGVSALGDIARDFVERKLHHIGVGMRKRKRSANAARRSDCAE